jgi:mono/diheme cytochrome c family protein
MPRRLTAGLPWLAGLFLCACYVGAGQNTDGGTGSEHAQSGDSGSASTDGLLANSGLPCNVAQVLATYCISCHGSSPSSGVSLMSLSDLKKTAKSDSTKNEGQLAVTRMQSGSMPPTGSAPSSSEISAFASWVQGGMKAGSCGAAGDGGGHGENPYGGPHVCTSGSYYTSGEGSSMAPGQACIACHATSGEAPIFSIAGTIYPTAHEPSGCYSTGVSGAQVEITDKNGSVTTYTVNSVGNFRGQGSIALPYKAKVLYAGRTRAMSASQSSGDCNVCHTENGTNSAPGRILLP